MKIPKVIVFFAMLCSSALALGGDVPAQATDSKPEEVVITGQRLRIELRQQMWAAEEKAYAVFNQFNDEKRFSISCSKSQPTGTRFITQTCQPEFEVRATRSHALDYLQSMRGFNEGSDGSVAASGEPMEVEILRQQADYKRKFREVAEKHPEFLRAIDEYSKARAKYEQVDDKSGK